MDCEPLQKINTITDMYFHGGEDKLFYIYPKQQPLINRCWDFYKNPCNNCKLLQKNNVDSYNCLGHNVGNPSTILCYEFHQDWYHNSYYLYDSKWTINNVGICQWFMITKPKQEVFYNAFMSCIENIDILINLEKNENYHYDVISNCGPLAFTKIILNNASDDIIILPSDFFCAGPDGGNVPLTKNAYVKHHFTGSWL
jgi:hypothetical protein